MGFADFHDKIYIPKVIISSSESWFRHRLLRHFVTVSKFFLEKIRKSIYFVLELTKKTHNMNLMYYELIAKVFFEGSPFSVLRTSFPRRGQENTVDQQLPLPPLGERD